MDREVAELERAIERIWEVGRAFGLDPFPTNFEIVPSTVMYEIGSYALPGRYSHWTFGKAYHRMKTMYDFGLSRIYEVVINANPSYGFLLETNSPLQNRLVIAHVMGHVDFFKHNAWFAATNRRMVDDAATHARRIAEYEFQHGRKVVERFLDAVLSIEEHVDPDTFLKRPANGPQAVRAPVPGRYDDLFDPCELPPPPAAAARIDGPELPEKDLLGFLAAHSPVLEPWQRDVVAMIREEMLYFVPQMRTKTINEGWASFWHSRIMRELDLSDDEHLEFAELHAGVVSPHTGQLNPYFVGYRILEDIERRYGRDRLFEVREVESDVSLLRNYLTEDLCEELDLFVYELVDDEAWTITDKRWERVRDQLVANMSNFGFPYIEVADGDHRGNRELFLKHRYEGSELDLRYARKTLENCQTLWGRPVWLETVVDGVPRTLHYDGSDHSES
ncbi:MAG: SpoVR family protein [Acidobacteria bacterium]|nr:SpoVR family protein [Acidobacteriota bacterium]